MLKSALQELEQVVADLLRSSSSPTVAGRREGLPAKVENICDQLIVRWTTTYLSAAKQPAILRFVRFHQAGITRLSNILFNDSPDPVSIAALKAMEKLLAYLRTHFYAEFDDSHFVTDFHRHHMLLDLRARHQGFTAHFTAGSSEQGLADAVFKSFNLYGKHSGQFKLSYTQLDSMIRIDAVLRQSAATGGGSFNEGLLGAIVQENFNSKPVVAWYKNYISAKLAGLQTAAAATFLTSEIKALDEMAVRGAPFEPAELPLTDSLRAWLSENLTNVSGRSPALIPEDIQVALNLSVAQFGLFLRLCYLTGCFHDDNISALLRFFSTRFTSKRQDHISFKSLGRTFYHSEQKHAAHIRDWLQRMIGIIDQRYFPK